MQISEITEVISADTFKRPIYAGNAIQTVQSTDAKKVITVRTASFASAAEGGSASVESISAAANPGLSTYVDDALSSSDRPELTSAKIIISGGRALGSSEKFQEVILPVADKLGAAVGASRAAVDAGYAPNDWQVGQTGKVVAPHLYIAVRHFRRHPASGRHEGLQGHRRHQQGRGSPDLPGRRLRPRRRSLRRSCRNLKRRSEPFIRKKSGDPSMAWSPFRACAAAERALSEHGKVAAAPTINAGKLGHMALSLAPDRLCRVPEYVHERKPQSPSALMMENRLDDQECRNCWRWTDGLRYRPGFGDRRLQGANLRYFRQTALKPALPRSTATSPARCHPAR